MHYSYATRRTISSQNSTLSIHNRNRLHNPILDQPNKFMRPAVAPAQMLSAPVAMTKRPRATRKPGMFKRRLTRLPAANRLRESNDLEADSLWIRERKFISAVIIKTVPFLRHMIKAPRAEPVARGVAGRQCSAIRNLHVTQLRHSLPNTGSD